MSGSNRPQVLGLVIMTRRRRARAAPRARRDRPGRGRRRGYFRPDSRRRRRWRDWLPCALSGTRITSRASPRAASAERIASRPHSSPCAPALRAHRDAVHAGEVNQPAGEFVDHREGPLHRVGGLQRVDVGEARHPRDLLVEPGIMLHRARAEREEAEIDRIILAAEAGVVPHRLGLGQPGEADRLGAREAARPVLPFRLTRRSRRRVVSASPISNSKGSSSISALLPVKVALMPALPRAPWRRPRYPGRVTVSVTATTRALARGVLTRIEPAERNAAEHAMLGHRPHRRSRFFGKLQG